MSRGNKLAMVFWVLLLAAVTGGCGGSSGPPAGGPRAGDEDLAGWPELAALGGYPRPDRVRLETTWLTGAWGFAPDPQDAGLSEQWFEAPDFPETIQVPFCVESEASGVGDADPPDVVWYARRFPAEADGTGRTLLHFGAVDYHAMVWLNGVFLGEHLGGYTPFCFELGGLLRPENTLVVRVEDALSDRRPRGKQSWAGEPHQVFYETVTGIWQPVWLERAGPAYLQGLRIVPDPATGRVAVEARVAGAAGPVEVKAMAVSPAGETAVATRALEKTEPVQAVDLSLAFPGLVPWSPDAPRLYRLRLVLRAGGGRDVVDTYFGARTIETAGQRVLLNGEELYQKLVLVQGYYAGGHYTPVDPDVYRQDIERVKAYGFNGLRMHEKIESPQFLFWADFLGALVWEELPSAWRFTGEQQANLERDWREAIQRDWNHPCIVTWVPFNEAWGLGIVFTPRIFIPAVLFPDRIAFMKRMAEATRELDPTRLVIDNSGWDHTGATDVVDIHHYLPTLERAADLYAELEDLYAYQWSLGRLLEIGINNNIFTIGEGYRGQPILVSEYGGFGWYNWQEPGDRVDAYRGATELIQAQPHIVGYCYTQFTDTYQEQNGLLDMDRNPNVPAEAIRAVNDGRGSRTR